MTADNKPPLTEDPRVPLAAERTFLAWLRTGLALMGFGFVMARFGLFMREMAALQKLPTEATHGFSLWVGVSLVALGVFLNMAALHRYRRYLKQLAIGVVPEPKPGLETVVALALIMIGFAALAALLVSAH